MKSSFCYQVITYINRCFLCCHLFQKILKSKWRPRDANRVLKHDLAVQKNWELLQSGKVEVDSELKVHLSKFTQRRIPVAQRPGNDSKSFSPTGLVMILCLLSTPLVMIHFVSGSACWLSACAWIWLCFKMYDTVHHLYLRLVKASYQVSHISFVHVFLSSCGLHVVFVNNRGFKNVKVECPSWLYH
jgi:hypothetical protein